MKWISIKDELPPIDEIVLLIDVDDPSPDLGWLEESEIDCEDKAWWVRNSSRRLEYFTHWAAIEAPEPSPSGTVAATGPLSSLEQKRLFLSLPMSWRRAILSAETDALLDQSPNTAAGGGGTSTNGEAR